MAYRFSTPKRGDIIVYKTGDDKKASTHIKRIIGLPGETIQIKDGMIYINGEVYLEKKDYPVMTDAGLAEEPVTLGTNQYFVLGDNRNNSEDSVMQMWELSAVKISRERYGLFFPPLIT